MQIQSDHRIHSEAENFQEKLEFPKRFRAWHQKNALPTREKERVEPVLFLAILPLFDFAQKV